MAKMRGLKSKWLTDKYSNLGSKRMNYLLKKMTTIQIKKLKRVPSSRLKDVRINKVRLILR